VLGDDRVTTPPSLAAGVVAADTALDLVSSAHDERTAAVVERLRESGGRRGRGWLIRRALALADVAGLTLAFGVTLSLAATEGTDRVQDRYELLVFALSLPLWIVVARLYGLYSDDEMRNDHSTADDLVGVFHLVTVGSWLLFLVATFTDAANPSVERVVSFWLLAILFVTSSRALARSLCRRTHTYVQNTLIVGAGEVGQLIGKKIRQHEEYGLNVVGFIDAEPKERQPGLGHLTILGTPDRLVEIVEAFAVERVVIAFSNESHENLISVVRSLRDLDVQIDIVPRLFEIIGPNINVHHAEGIPMIGLPPLRLSRSALLLKRTLDVASAALGLIVLSPLMLAVGFAIKLDSPGPVYFRQVRMGRGGHTFEILKFRTMQADAEERKDEVRPMSKHVADGGDPRMFKVVDDPRITRVGKVLRRLSWDELPQLTNVLRGEMSLVGPRPLILEEDNYVVDWRRERLNLKPGITGIWQVLGRDDIPFEEMVKLDYLYVTNWSLLGDVKLILRTIPILFRPSAR
jgi:exopolysaccharide biosynthesis polyprenyl glycosylphosphotransferase